MAAGPMASFDACPVALVYERNGQAFFYEFEVLHKTVSGNSTTTVMGISSPFLCKMQCFCKISG